MDRRTFLRVFGNGTALVAANAACGNVKSPTRSSKKPPNIVLIMADDMGFSDIGCYGGEISTPNLDRLAANGLRFSQFYNTARCCPTRASLLTGLYPHQAGIGHMVGNRGIPAYQGYLNNQCLTVAEALKQAGYTTLMSGKWHVGEKRPHWPTDRGFDRYFGLISGGTNYFKLDRARQMAVDDRPFTPEGEDFYLTDAFSDQAVKLIDEAERDAPFFLYVAYTAPHWPLHAKPKDIAKYKGKYLEGWDVLREQRHARLVKVGIVDGQWQISARDKDAPGRETVQDKELEDLKMAVYAAQIDCMDQGIGRILDEIREIGELDNTLVLFLADNGGCAEEINIPQGDPRNSWGDPKAPPGPGDSFRSYGLPWANASNTPFRMYKHWVHEGGIASPLICHWPEGIEQKNEIAHDVSHVIDIMATCLDVAESKYPGSYQAQPVLPTEGRSILPVLSGGQRERHPALFWEHEGNRAVRRNRWKLVSRFQPAENKQGPWELYNMESDRTETHDRASEKSETVVELSGLYDAWAARTGVVAWEELRTRR